MKFSVVVVLLLAIVSASAGVLVAWGMHFPQLSLVWSETLAIALSTLLLALGAGLSRAVADGIAGVYERFYTNRFPEAIWLWRRDWRRRISHAQPASSRSFVFTLLVLTGSIAIALMARFMPDERAAVIGFAALLSTVLLALVANAGIRRDRTAPRGALQFDNIPATVGGVAEFRLGMPRRRENTRWEGFLVCDRLVLEPEKRGRRYVTCERREQMWRTGIVPQIIHGAERNQIKFSFDVPADAVPTGPYRNGRVEWRVMVRGVSRTGEVCFDKEFVVPISSPSRGASDVRWAALADRSGAMEFDDFDSVLLEEPGPITASNEVLKGPVWQGLIDGLANAEIGLFSVGMQFGDSVWRATPTFEYAKRGVGVWMVALLVLLGIAAVNDVWSFPVGVSYVVAAMGVLIGLSQSLFHFFHRFDLEFRTDALVIQHRWLGVRWSQPIPWGLFETVTWERVGFGIPASRRVVVNPGEERWCRVVSPSLIDGVVVDNMLNALELCRAVHRQPATALRRVSKVRSQVAPDLLAVSGYNSVGGWSLGSPVDPLLLSLK